MGLKTFSSCFENLFLTTPERGVMPLRITLCDEIPYRLGLYQPFCNLKIFVKSNLLIFSMLLKRNHKNSLVFNSWCPEFSTERTFFGSPVMRLLHVLPN